MSGRRQKISTRMLALTGLLSAVCLVLLFAAGVAPSGWTGLTAVAGLAVAVAVSASGYLSGVLCYLVSGILGLLLVPGKHAAVLFLCLFGVYPLLKNLLERLKNRTLEILLKLAFCEAVLALLYLLAYPIFFASAVSAWSVPIPFVPVFFVLAGIIFLIYDYAFSRVMAMLQARLIPLFRQKNGGH